MCRVTLGHYYNSPDINNRRDGENQRNPKKCSDKENQEDLVAGGMSKYVGYIC